MEARPFAAALIAAAVLTSSTLTLSRVPEESRVTRLIRRFPELARPYRRTGQATMPQPADVQAMTYTRSRARAADNESTNLPRFIPDPYLRRSDEISPGENAYERALRGLLSAQRRLTEYRKDAYDERFAGRDAAVAESRITFWKNTVERIERDLEEKKVFSPPLPEPLVERGKLLVRFGADATESQIHDLFAQHHLEIESGIPEIALFFVVSSDPPAATFEREAARLEALVESLESFPFVESATENLLLHPDFLPRRSTPQDRDWYLPGDAFSRSTFPEAWNFKDGMKNVAVGILDGGFLTNEDIEVKGLNAAPCDSSLPLLHGTLLAGVIGARFDNKKDTDGGVPDVTLIGCGVATPLTCPDPHLIGHDRDVCINAAAIETYIYGLRELLTHGIKIINASISYNWRTISVDTTEPKIRKIVADHGDMVVDLMALRPQAILIASAGNDSGAPAEWASPFNHAALRPSGASKNIIVADAVDLGGAHLPHSNVGGTIKAIAHEIFAAINPDQSYAFAFDTSGAAAMVTATVALMRAADPTISPDDIKTRLNITGGTAPELRAYPAVRQCFAKPDAVLADINGKDGITEADFLRFKTMYKLAINKMLPDNNHDGVKNECDGKFLREDLNVDGCINKLDLEIMIDAWGLSGADADRLRRRLDQ